MARRAHPGYFLSHVLLPACVRVQMDGITSKADSGMVMVLATSNTPWDLDEALRRRLEKRIHIPLPGLEARTQMFGLNLKDVPTEDSVSPDDLAADTEGCVVVVVIAVAATRAPLPATPRVDPPSDTVVFLLAACVTGTLAPTSTSCAAKRP